MAELAQFASVPRLELGSLGTANTALDGTGTFSNPGIIMIGGTSGSRIERVHFQATQTTTAGVIRVFRASAPLTYTMIDQILVSAVTSSNTAIAWSGDLYYGSANPLFLPAGIGLIFTTSIAQTFNLAVIGADL